jgi:WD40 repeat protein
VKIWDLRKGQILYSLYGHEGPTTGAEFSPFGDYLLTGGADTNIVIWSTNMNETKSEILQGTTQAKVGTDMFITDKPDIKELPDEKKRGPSGLKNVN